MTVNINPEQAIIEQLQAEINQQDAELAGFGSEIVRLQTDKKELIKILEAALEALGRLGSAKPLTSSDPGHPARENIRRVAFAKDYLDRIKAMEETDDI